MTFGISAATLATVGGSIAGGLIAANASGDAADTQAQSGREATQAQRDMFERQVQLQEPWRQAGIAGLGQLNMLLGLTPAGAGGAGGAGVETADQIRARLAPQFMSQAAPQPPPGFSPLAGPAGEANGSVGDAWWMANKPGLWQFMPQGQQQSNAGLDAAVQAEIARQQAAQAQTTQTAQADPAFGSLMKPFGTADFQTDPGFQFRQQQGEQSLQRAASRMGGLNSGKYLKDAMGFNQGLASQEYSNAYNRYNTNQGNQFNRLASISGIGQTAANQVGSAASNFGSQIGSNIIGAGNALAAGQVGGANAINSGIGQGLSMYQQNEMLKRLPFYGGTPYNPGAASPMGDYPMFNIG